MTGDGGADRIPAGFDELLRERRRAAGLTQADLAAQAGVGIRTVRDLERGRSSRPQRTTVELIADALGLRGFDRADFVAAGRGMPAAGWEAPGGTPGTAPAGGSVPPVGGGPGLPARGGRGLPAGGGSRPPAGGGPGVPMGGGPGRPAGSSSGPGGPAGGPGLPAPVDLIGRDGDIAEVADLLTLPRQPPVRLVSLVGLAGVGKTGLGLAVGHRVAADFPGGVAGIVITEGGTESDVLAVVATVFGVGRAPDLAARLAGPPALLVVDAVERAPGPVAEALRWLLAAAPAVRILTTGRHPVGLPGERVWPVTPLEVPPADPAAGPAPEAPAEAATDPDGLARAARYPAVRLLLARLGQVRRDPPGPDELPALIALVRRLGGLPLAIELAAARGHILDLNEMLARYGHRVLDLAQPPATREAVAVTLRDAVAASYRLLEPAERAALRRLSAFRNRWSVELAEAMLVDQSVGGPADRSVEGPGDQPVGGPAEPFAGGPADRSAGGAVEPVAGGAGEPPVAGPGDAATGGPGDPGPEAPGDLVPLLDRLLALGLLSVRGTGPFRFRLLDVVRDFATERAAARGELAAIRRRHAVVLARLAARAAPELAGGQLVPAVSRLDEVTGDLWAALAHAAVDDPHTALGLAASLVRWWRFRGRDVAGRQWLRRLLDDPRTADADPLLRAWARVGVAQLAQEHGAGQEELPTARRALAEFQRRGDVGGEIAARSVLCALWTALGGYEEARRHGTAVLALASRTGRIRDMAVAQNNLTWHEIRVGDLPAARRRLAAVDRLAAQCGEDRLRALARANLAEVARLDGRYAEAVETGRRVLAVLAELGDPGHRRRVLGTVGLALAQAGRLDEATVVLAELRAAGSGASGTAGLAEETAVPRDDGVVALIEAVVAARRGNREWAAEWFAAAVREFAGIRDFRDVVEALVGLVASTDDRGGRAAALVRLEQVCREGAIRLLPREREVLAGAGVVVPELRAEPGPLSAGVLP